MKRFAPYLPFALAFLMLLSGCKKIDWRPTNECQVQQFSSIDFPPTPGEGAHPYLFSKTFDASGMVSTMDAYLFTIGPDSRHLKVKLTLQGQKLYLLNRDKANDTFVVVTLNAKGRPVRADEKFTDPFFTGLRDYTFEYDNKNRVSVFTQHVHPIGNFVPPPASQPVTYDSYGNALEVPNAGFEYDYTRTAKQQYYMDFDAINIYYGFKLLQYLNMFPEINSPKHVRIRSKVIPLGVGVYYLNAALSNHQFDSKGKLTNYNINGNGFLPATAAITWYCDSGNQ